MDKASDESRAEAVNNLALPRAVGWNASANIATLWINQGGFTNWSAFDLNDLIPAACNSNISLRQAYDINDDNWIIAVGDGNLNQGGIQWHAYVLTPIDTCLWDLNGDSVVGILDLLNLLAAWGPCGDPPQSCFADLNCDGEVDVLDLLILIANWGKCPGEQGPPPKSLKKEIQDAGLTWPDDWDLFEECMTTGTPEEQDNCRCWFDRYFNGCPADCSQLPACGGYDPFNECPGDFTGPLGEADCRVDAFDNNHLLACWGKPCGDLTGDCTTDAFDLNILLAEWGACPLDPLCGPGPELTCDQGAQGGGGGGGSGPQGGGGSDGGPDSSPSLTAALAQMGFDSVAAYQAYITTLSDTEAFASASVLLALLEAQP